jgi:hypothetical protein
MNINSKEREYTANSTLTFLGGIHEAKKRQDLYVLNWKSSYDVMLFIHQSHEQPFAEF